MKLGDNGEAFFVQEMDNDQVRVKTNFSSLKIQCLLFRVSFEFRNFVEKYTFTRFIVLKVSGLFSAVEIQYHAVTSFFELLRFGKI